MRAEKKYLIDEVETHLKKSDYVILANYNGMTVADAAELRKRLSAEKAEYHVVKNSSLRVAAKSLGLPDIEGALIGPTAIVVAAGTPRGLPKSSSSSSRKSRRSRSSRRPQQEAHLLEGRLAPRRHAVA